ncbi:MAG TPA: hypothetical protein ACFYED_00195 [Candidatus Tripitaka californicus]|uniref:hypothetical protein n=1 Tax=Candidatus Tripitaka californicus TaxID=3367616 RepID=UPI004029584B
MAEKDITGRAADNVARIVMGAMGKVKKAVPMGPGRVQMTPSEVRERLARKGADPQALQQLMRQLGPEQAMKLLLNTKDSSAPSTPEEFFGRETE